MPNQFTNGYGPQTNFEAWRQKGGPLTFSESSLFALQQAVDNPQSFSKLGQSARKNLSNLFGMNGAYSYDESDRAQNAMAAGVAGEDWLAQHEYSASNGYEHHMPIHPIIINSAKYGTSQFTGQTDFVRNDNGHIGITDTKFAFFDPWYTQSKHNDYIRRYGAANAQDHALQDFIYEKKRTYSRSPQALLYTMGVPQSQMQFDMRVYNKPEDVLNSIKSGQLAEPMARSVFGSAYNNKSNDERFAMATKLAEQGVQNVFSLYGQGYPDITQAAQTYSLNMQNPGTSPKRNNSIVEQADDAIATTKSLLGISDQDYDLIEPKYLKTQMDLVTEYNTIRATSGENRNNKTKTFSAGSDDPGAEQRYWDHWRDTNNWGGQPDEILGGTTGTTRLPFTSNNSFGSLHQQLQAYYSTARRVPLDRKDRYTVNLSRRHWAKGEDEYAARIASTDSGNYAETGDVEDQIISEKLQLKADSDRAAFKADKANKRAQLEEQYPGLDASKITRLRSQDSLDKVFHDLTQQGKALVQAQKEEERQSKKAGVALSQLGGIHYFNPYRIRDEAQNQWGSVKGASRGILPKDFETIGTRFGDYLSAQLNADTAQGEGLWNAGSAILPSVLGAAAGTATTYLSGGNAALGLGAFQAVKGITAGVSQGLGNKRQADITQAGQQLTADINLVGMVKSVVSASFAPLKLFAKAVAGAAAAALGFIGTLTSFVGKGVSGTTYNMGMPLMSLTASDYGDYQTSTRADMLIGASKGTVSGSIQDWRQQSNMLYTQGQLNDGRVISASLGGAGGFGAVYNANSGANAYNSMYAYIDRQANEIRSMDSDSASRRMSQIEALDPTIAKLVQRTVTNAQVTGHFESVNSLINPQINYHKFTTGEYNTYEKDRVKYEAYKDSFDISKMRIAVAIWDKIGDKVANVTTTIADMIANGNFSEIPGYIKSVFANKELWDGIKVTVTGSIKDLLGNVLKSLATFVPQIYAKIKPFSDKIFDFIYDGIIKISDLLNRAFSDLYYKIADVHIDPIALLTGKGDVITSKSRTEISKQADNTLHSFKDTPAGRRMDQNQSYAHIMRTMQGIEGTTDNDNLARNLGVFLTTGSKDHSNRYLSGWYDIVQEKIRNGESIGIYLNQLDTIDPSGYYTKGIREHLKNYNLEHNLFGRAINYLDSDDTRKNIKDTYDSSQKAVFDLVAGLLDSGGNALISQSKEGQVNVKITMKDEKTGKEQSVTLPSGVFGVRSDKSMDDEQFSLIASYQEQAGIKGGLNP